MKEWVCKEYTTTTLNGNVFGGLQKEQELVRCKDCINCVKEPNGELYCDILAVGYEPLGSKKVTDDWFCADGERNDIDESQD